MFTDYFHRCSRKAVSIAIVMGVCLLGTGRSDAQTYSVLNFGAVADGILRSDGQMSAGSGTLTSASGNFTSSDAGKTIQVVGAGPGGTSRFDGSMSFGSANLSSPSGVFASTDVGRGIVVVGAGAGVTNLVTTIRGYNSPQSVTLNANAGAVTTGAPFYFGAMTLEGTIQSVQSSTTVTLSTPALATISNGMFAYGTENHAAFQAAVDTAGQAGGGTVRVPVPGFCPSGAVCGYVVRATDQMTAKSPASVKIRYNNVSLVGDSPQTNLFCRGAWANYSNTPAFPGVTAEIRGACLTLGDNGGPNGAAGQSVSNVTVSHLHLYGMTNGNTFHNDFTPTTPPLTTTGDGWDETHKAIYMWANSSFSNITMDSLVIQDFKGENIYSGGSVINGMVISNCTITNFNSDGISIEAKNLQVLNNVISNGSNAAIENSSVGSGPDALVSQIYQGNTFSSFPREGLVVVGVDGTLASGSIVINNNYFDTIGVVNGSGTQSAIYIATQGSGVAPANVTVTGNTCHDCYSFGVFQTSGNTTVSGNNFIVDKYRGYAFLTFMNALKGLTIANNVGSATSQAPTPALSAVYVINPGWATGGFPWNNVVIKGNSWTFPGTPHYNFGTSSGLGWRLVTGFNLNWQGDTCNGCTHNDLDHGLLSLNSNTTIEPLGPVVYVQANSSVVATVDASKEQDGAQLQIVNSGSSPVVFQPDGNLSLSSPVTLPGGGAPITLLYRSSVGKFTLASGVPTISAVAGITQSATVNANFGTALQALLKDAGGNPMSGATVTFTAPGSGPGARFGGSVSATAVTNGGGVATAPALTANNLAGSYVVTASAAGVAATAGFSLTNNAAAGASIVAMAGSGQSTTAGTNFGTALQAMVKDGNGNPMGGAMVTFTAPSGGASGVFGGSSTASVVTAANGVATAPTLTANSQVGSYPVTASTATATSPATFTLSNAAAVGTPPVSGTGSLTGSASTSAAAVNLSAEGGQDWVHWGDGALTRKAGVSAQLSNYTVVGSGGVNSYNNDPRPVSWSDGTPLASSTNNANGVYIVGIGAGFSFTAPADTATRTLLVHVGGWFSGGTLTAHLSDGSASDYVNITAAVNGQYDGNYTLTYRAGAAAQTLKITWVVNSGSGNVTLNAAALLGSSITASAGVTQSTAVNTNFGTALQATVRDGTGNPMSGATVTFTAPSSGASATFGGSSTGTGVTNGSGVATAPVLTANGQAGSYVVTASTAGIATSASYSLTNSGATAASILASAGGAQSTTVNSNFGTALQVLVKDGSGNPVNGATVTFTAPGSGASAKFGSSLTTTAVTNGSGVATAPTLTAGSQMGSYTVTASAAGVTTPAGFSLTNTAGAAASISASAGVSQSTSVGTNFGTTLQAVVKDAGGNPVNGATVTFTAPVSGASARFAGSTTAAVVTNGSGVATAPALTANSTAGNYVVTASTAGVASTAGFSLTNNVGAAQSITAGAGSTQSAGVGTNFGSALQVLVKDGGGNAVNGATVVFTAPGGGASGVFGSSITATAVTNSGGQATSPTVTANSQVGSYIVTASTAGVAASASFSLTNVATGSQRIPILTGAVNTSVAGVNLTTEGGQDWVHWGDGTLNRKAGVGAQLSNYSIVGSGPVMTYNNDPRPVSWSDGSATVLSSNNTNGIYIVGMGAGFRFTAPADLTPRTLIVHVGGWFSGGTLTAHLSDSSVPDYVNVTQAANGQYDGNYTLTYQAGAAGQTLTVTWVVSSGAGNVTLNAAALTATSIIASAGAMQSTSVNANFATALQAFVKDGANNPVSGATVIFNAPPSGASAAFGGSLTATAVTNSSGVATAPALTANGLVGSYTVLATTAGGSAASYALSNTAGGQAGPQPGSLTGAMNFLAGSVNLTAEGGQDWVHWGDGIVNRKAGVIAQLSNLATLGAGGAAAYSDDPRTVLWSDGAPTVSSSNNAKGLYISGRGAGFSFTAPADATPRTLIVHVGGWYSGGTLTARLSDGSAPDYVNVTPGANGQFDGNYTLTYRAAAAGQTLTVTWVLSSGAGNVTLNAAALR